MPPAAMTENSCLARGLLAVARMLLALLAGHGPIRFFAWAGRRSAIARQAGSWHVRRGVTPVELLAAIGALAILGVATSLVVRLHQRDDSQRVAEEGAERIRNAAEQWQQEHATGCPTISQLVHDRALEPDARVDDPWGSRYRVVCSGPMLSVRSSGKDGETGTADDIRVPRS